MQSTSFKLLPLEVADEVAAYVAPETMDLTSLRIAEEPTADTTAGVPFLGTQAGLKLTRPPPYDYFLEGKRLSNAATCLSPL